MKYVQSVRDYGSGQSESSRCALSTHSRLAYHSTLVFASYPNFQNRGDTSRQATPGAMPAEAKAKDSVIW
jgi:hypothetical protein